MEVAADQVKIEMKGELLRYLPAIYQEPDRLWIKAHPSTGPNFLDCFLLAFEKVLLGRNDGVEPDQVGSDNQNGAEGLTTKLPGLEKKIANLHVYFDPWDTPEEFLAWLAGWAALSLRADLSLHRRRKLVASIIPLYRTRGTKKYLNDLLGIYLGSVATEPEVAKFEITEPEIPELQLGVHSTISEDSHIGGGPPHFFRAKLNFLEFKSPEELDIQCQIAQSVIDLAKPAHTAYELDVVLPTMQIGVRSTVGFDSFLAA